MVEEDEGAEGGESPRSRDGGDKDGGEEAMGPNAQLVMSATEPKQAAVGERLGPQSLKMGLVPEVSPCPGEGKVGASKSEMGATLKIAMYHERAVASRSVEEGGEARVTADRLVGVVEDAAVRSMA